MMRMPSILIAAFFAVASVPVSAAADPAPAPADVTVPTVTAQALKALQKSKTAYYLIDVRTPEEFAQGHIAGAVLLPLDALANRYRQIPKGVKLVVYCRSGHRSAQAVAFLREKGYTQAASLQGGILAWQAAP